MALSKAFSVKGNNMVSMEKETAKIVHRVKRRGSECSVSSIDSWISRGSTISSVSSSFSDYFSTVVLPLELELSIMGTVDQCLLDRAQVAQIYRSRVSPRSTLSRPKCRSNLDIERNDTTSFNDQEMLSTTFCSTEL